MNTYYILEDGEQLGPYGLDELTRMDLEVYTEVLSSKSETWQTAGDLPELYPYFEAREIYLPTGDNLASFGWRVLAYVIDYVILSFAMNLIFRVLASFGISFNIKSLDDLLNLPILQIFLLQFITSATLIIYNTICEASAMKGSIGKKLCKLVVVDANGNGQSFGNALLRSAGKAVSIFFVYTGFISIFFTDHKQAMHDFLAKTYVVKINS
jgi:uncharacterized RDD family membrane protein YckC